MNNKNNLIDYQATVIEIKKHERQIEQYFNILAAGNENSQSRCADYGERCIIITMPYDDINIDQLTIEKVSDLKELLVRYQELRRTQRRIEEDISKDNAIKSHLNNSVRGYF